MAPTEGENAVPLGTAGDERPAPPRPLTFREVTALSLAWGYAALLVLACAAVVLNLPGLSDTLDVRRLFR